jgi:hypothetical protein
MELLGGLTAFATFVVVIFVIMRETPSYAYRHEQKRPSAESSIAMWYRSKLGRNRKTIRRLGTVISHQKQHRKGSQKRSTLYCPTDIMYSDSSNFLAMKTTTMLRMNGLQCQQFLREIKTRSQRGSYLRRKRNVDTETASTLYGILRCLCPELSMTSSTTSLMTPF